jgi:hypothetical protein
MRNTKVNGRNIAGHGAYLKEPQTSHHFDCCMGLKKYYKKKSSIEACEQQWRFNHVQAKLKIKTY